MSFQRWYIVFILNINNINEKGVICKVHNLRLPVKREMILFRPRLRIFYHILHWHSFESAQDLESTQYMTAYYHNGVVLPSMLVNKPVL